MSAAMSMTIVPVLPLTQPLATKTIESGLNLDGMQIDVPDHAQLELTQVDRPQWMTLHRASESDITFADFVLENMAWSGSVTRPIQQIESVNMKPAWTIHPSYKNQTPISDIDGLARKAYVRHQRANVPHARTASINHLKAALRSRSLSPNQARMTEHKSQIITYEEIERMLMPRCTPTLADFLV